MCNRTMYDPFGINLWEPLVLPKFEDFNCGYRITKDGTYVVEYLVPGAKRRDLKLSVEAQTLTLKYEGTNTEDERSFTKSIRLPNEADLSTINATYVNGILTVRISPRTSQLVEIK